jgi:hypothetical protein
MVATGSSSSEQVITAYRRDPSGIPALPKIRSGNAEFERNDTFEHDDM